MPVLFAVPFSPFPSFMALLAQGRGGTFNDNNVAAWWPAIIIPILVIVIVLYVWSSIRATQPFRIESSTTLPDDAAVDHIIEGYVRAGWSANTLSDGRVLFSRTTKPDIGTTIALGLFFVLPALIYLVSSQRRQTAELWISDADDRLTHVEILGNTTGYGGVNTAAGILRSLPKPD